ncbi:MAG: beta-N-acetylglucosaminidase, partial [Sphingobacteriaceae bacterium]
MMLKLFALLFFCFTSTVFAQNHAANLKQVIQFEKAEKSVVLLNNQNNTIPLIGLNKLRIASVHFNFKQADIFDGIANKYWKIESFNADTIRNNQNFNALHDELKLYNTVILELSAASSITSALKSFINDLESNTQLIIVLAGSDKNLSQLDKVKSPIIYYPEDNSDGASIAAQVIFGGIALNNRLDQNYSVNHKKGAGFSTQKIRLGYSLPEAVTLNSDVLKGIDSIVNKGIATHSSPCVVVLLAKDGKVIFHKAYGKHTYNGAETTKLDDIFDMASVTKVTATVPMVMALYDKKQLSLDSPISKYVAVTRNLADKNSIIIREALLHEAGYTPYIKFYERLKSSDMSVDSSAAYPTKVADHYYLRANYFKEVMWPVMLQSKVETHGKYVYSDISMYMMKEVVEEITHQKLNDFVLNELYLPLGMQSSGFLPRNRFPKSRIVPTTENDNWFRNMLVQGYVNDPGAAMAGGVEGHAGLFSNANDLAIFYQMLLNKGSYGGQKFYDPATVDLFTSRQSKTSWRGLGYDKYNSSTKLPSAYASEQA